MPCRRPEWRSTRQRGVGLEATAVARGHSVMVITSARFLLYRVYHVADVRFRIATTVAAMCSHSAVRLLQSGCSIGLPNIPGADVCPLCQSNAARIGARRHLLALRVVSLQRGDTSVNRIEPTWL